MNRKGRKVRQETLFLLFQYGKPSKTWRFLPGLRFDKVFVR